jgi:hypothetical protein
MLAYYWEILHLQMTAVEDPVKLSPTVAALVSPVGRCWGGALIYTGATDHGPREHFSFFFFSIFFVDHFGLRKITLDQTFREIYKHPHKTLWNMWRSMQYWNAQGKSSEICPALLHSISILKCGMHSCKDWNGSSFGFWTVTTFVFVWWCDLMTKNIAVWD